MLADSAVAATAETAVTLGASAPVPGTTTLQLERDICTNPALQIVVKDASGTVLDSYVADLSDLELSCDVAAAPVTAPSSGTNIRTIALYVIGAVAVLLIVLGGVFWMLRRRSRQPKTTEPKTPTQKSEMSAPPDAPTPPPVPTSVGGGSDDETPGGPTPPTPPTPPKPPTVVMTLLLALIVGGGLLGGALYAKHLQAQTLYNLIITG